MTTVTWRAARWGILAAGILVAFYALVLVTASGFGHLRDQVRQDWWLLAPIMFGFAIHIALVAELRQRHSAHHLAATTGAGAGSSTVGMIACCAHHLAELAPFIGATGAAAVLFDWRVPLMLGGGSESDAATWSGTPSGGHHREGELMFTHSGDPSGDVTLSLSGLPEPVVLAWTTASR